MDYFNEKKSWCMMNATSDSKLANIAALFNVYLKDKTTMTADDVVCLANELANADEENYYDVIEHVNDELANHTKLPFSIGDKIKYKESAVFKPTCNTGIIIAIDKGAYPGFFNITIRRDDGSIDMSYPGDIVKCS